MRRSIAASILLAAAVSLALSVAACGRKGDPYLPKDQQNTFPDQYPKSTQPQGGIFSGS
ncbi:putative small lipoprotein YifL [Dongia mobilis]|uniref:Putative small lipoprotein YifL n=1 Tax=Dongia mobilis TaxID=578943 RepID=A0A4R6WWY6_9PROT|nr:lipoprotein [Dongia mobilis]TDQ83913.1 putative small lipoprotein YifL [Dongia mobilis]